MTKVAVTYSPEVGGASVVSLKKSFSSVNCEVLDADYREMLRDIPKEEFEEAYKTPEGRNKLFAHAKFVAEKFLDDVDCLALSGNSAMIDPYLFNQERIEGASYDFSRTIAELALVHVATQRGMPIMGVCGGHQVVAVYGGGTIKDLNSTELDKQKFMNYDAIQFNADSMLKQIIAPNQNSDTPLEQEFFGAHNQTVNELGDGFVKTAVGSDGNLIEAAESEHGAPVITTQFHPEITVHGLPSSPFLYKKSKSEIETSLKIFDFFAKAGETYKNKKNLMNEIRGKFKKIEAPLLKEKKEEQIKLKTEESKKETFKKEVRKKEQTKSPVSKFINYVSNLIDKVKGLFRALISNKLTSSKVRKLKKQEELIGVDGSKKKNPPMVMSTEKIIRIQMANGRKLFKIEENNTNLDAAVEKENKSPAEVMTNEPAKEWSEKKQDAPEEEALTDKRASLNI